MGWLTVKNQFNIPDSVIVHVKDNRLILGVPFIPDFFSIEPDGQIACLADEGLTSIFNQLLTKISSNPESFSEAFRAPDIIDPLSLTKVWEVSDDGILEDWCFVPGFPHVTVSGKLMHHNTHFLNKQEAINTAILNAERRAIAALVKVDESIKAADRAHAELSEANRALSVLISLKTK